ncbi:unnamed protein product, partial [Ectocarpus sp. 12 AP-2014]
AVRRCCHLGGSYACVRYRQPTTTTWTTRERPIPRTNIGKIWIIRAAFSSIHANPCQAGTRKDKDTSIGSDKRGPATIKGSESIEL